MTPFKRLAGLLAVIAILLAAWGLAQAQRLKPLTEADVLKLVELQIDDTAIASRIVNGGLSFKVDDAVLARLKNAGASEPVLAALRKAGGLKPEPVAAKKRPLMVFTERFYTGSENPLQSELSINGESVGVFRVEQQKPIDKYLKKGWNTIALKTVPQYPASGKNSLSFAIGPVCKDGNDKLIMEHVYWKFWNSEDWSFEKGKFQHKLGPDVKEVTLSFRVFYAGPEFDEVKVRNGDYLLSLGSYYGDNNPDTIPTTFVNGTPLNSFMMGQRDVVITSLLKKGKNEIKLVTSPIKNQLQNNATSVKVRGPAEYSVAQGKFLLPAILDVWSSEGWVRDRKNGQLVVKDQPKAENFERVLTFNLEEAPKGR
jgi:hypothetical protein